MLKIPKLPFGKISNTEMFYAQGSHSEPEIVAPLGTVNKALIQALKQCAESEIQITLKLGDKKC